MSSLHFLKCLEQDDLEFYGRMAARLKRIASEASLCKKVFGKLYSPSLSKTIASLGFDVLEVKAAGHYVTVGERKIFDGVAGIACSIRGHNPLSYVQEIAALDGVDCRKAVGERLKDLTHLDCLVPAVSGAAAVENALKIGLAAQFPRKYVLALENGFGGKTLFALTGTAKPSYKERIDPLYPNVIYVDPFGEQAIEELESTFRQYAIGVVQLELIQAVGGVRAIPEAVVRYLDRRRAHHGYLLFVDEVQTGMYRTGPFSMCDSYGIVPDLMTIGKGTSDMMFPFAMTLYSAEVQRRLDRAECDLPSDLRARADYEIGYRTLLNVLDYAEKNGLSSRVKEAGALFSTRLAEVASSSVSVRDVRVFGLLIAIELEVDRSFRKWFRKRTPFLYILNMLLHREFPLLMGYCQYEANVLKLTPPLTIGDDEIARVCDTIADVLEAPLYRLLPSALGHLTETYVRGTWKCLLGRNASHEPVAR